MISTMPIFRLLWISIIAIAVPSDAIPWNSRSNHTPYCQPCPCSERHRTAYDKDVQNPLRASPSMISEHLFDVTKDRIRPSQNSNRGTTDSSKMSQKPFLSPIKTSQSNNQVTTTPAKTTQNSHEETTDLNKTSENPTVGSIYPKTIHGNPNDVTTDPVKTTRNSYQRTTDLTQLSERLYLRPIDQANTSKKPNQATTDSANTPINSNKTTMEVTNETTIDPTIETTIDSTIETTADSTIETTIDQTIETTAYSTIETTSGQTTETTADPTIETTTDTTKTCENPKQRTTDPKTTHESPIEVTTYLATTTHVQNQGAADIPEKIYQTTTNRVKTTRNSNHGIRDPAQKFQNPNQGTTFLAMMTRNHRHVPTDSLKMSENPNTTTKDPEKIARSLQQGSAWKNPADAVAFSGTRNVNQYFFKPGPVIFNNVITNIGGGYDYRYGVFTAYQPGIYLVKYHVAIHRNSTKKTVVNLRKNRQVVSSFNGSGFSSGLSNTIVLFLKRRDMLFVQGRAKSTINCGEVGDALCSFNVVLLKRGVFSDSRNPRPVPGW